VRDDSDEELIDLLRPAYFNALEAIPRHKHSFLRPGREMLFNQGVWPFEANTHQE
jgi:hypothetical protein